MASKSVKLVYFHGRGRAELCRWILAQAGVEYEHKRILFDDWKDLKPNTPTGTLPYIEIDGKELGCSGAIAVYLSKQYGFMGSDDWDEANISMICEAVSDAATARVQAHFCKHEDMQKELFKTYEEITLPNLLRTLSKRLEGGHLWLVGDKLSLADIAVAVSLDAQKPPFDAIVKACTSVMDLVNRVRELPNISQWIATRPDTTF